jgi:glycosyltransferase involved in cell wall biosynthesis
LDKARSLNVLLEAFAIVKSKDKKVKLLLVGDGSDNRNLQELAVTLGVSDDVVFTGQVANSEVSKFIAAADIGISPVPPLNCYKISSPIKLLEYLAEAKPAIANDEIFDQREVLEQSGGGILVSFNPDSFACAMMELVDNPVMAQEMGRKGQEWVINNRSYEILARQLERRYLELVKSKIA